MLNCKLPVFYPAAMHVLRYLSRADIEVSAIVELIESDPALATELLAVANSARYSCAATVRTIQHAIMLLGLRETRNLAITATMWSVLRQVPDRRAVEQCWRHSVACALIANDIATGSAISGDIAYTLGLLHDIGRIAVLGSERALRYRKIFDTPFETPAEILEAEQKAFGFDHASAGTWMISSWRLPNEFLAPILQHHHCIDSADLAGVLACACQCADLLGFMAIPYRGDNPENIMPRSQQWLRLRGERFRCSIAQAIESFGILPDADYKDEAIYR